MQKSLLLARSSIRKNKGQTVSIAVLVLLAALLLNLWLMLTLDYTKNFERQHDRLHAEHVTFAFACDEEPFKAFLNEEVSSDPRVSEYTLSDVFRVDASVPYSDGKLTSQFLFISEESARTRTIGKYEILQREGGDGVILPYLFYAIGSYKCGDSITFTAGKSEITFTVRGFYNNMMTGSFNCGMCAMLLSDAEYSRLCEQSFATPNSLLSVRLHDRSQSELVEADIHEKVSNAYPQVTSFTNSYALVSQSRFITQMICSGIISMAAVLVAIIALVVIASNVSNNIREEMKRFGTLKAVGYTSKQLIGSLLFEYVGIALLATLPGIGLSYALFPALNSMLTAQTGIPYAMRFLPVPALLTVLAIPALIALTAFLSAIALRKIEPIVALRQGVQTHSFKRNYVPLSKARVPVSVSLALKTSLTNVRQNVTMAITALAMSFILVFSGLMIRNVMVDISPMIDLIAGEVCDTAVIVQNDEAGAFVERLEQDDRVEKFYLFTNVEVRHIGGKRLYAVVVDDMDLVSNRTMVYKGRYPKYPNEVAVGGKYAEERHLHVGDEIALKAGDTEQKFLICGFTQISNYLGDDCLLTLEGYERMTPLGNPCYYLNLVAGSDVKAFNNEIAQANGVLNVVDVSETIGSTASVYVSVITAIVFAVLVLGLLVVAFVLYLLVRALLNRKRQEYGILKSLGFTTKQLVLITALGFMPVFTLSLIVGLTVAGIAINPLMSLFLRSIGMMKCMLPIPIGLLAGMGAMMVVFAFGFACLLSLRIKKVAPIELLTNE